MAGDGGVEDGGASGHGGDAGSTGGTGTTQPWCTGLCQHGYCVSFSWHDSCVCDLGYWGALCENRDPCTPHPCNHGGCTVGEGGTAICSCAAGYTGERCDSDIDECTTNNGGCDPLVRCTNTTGSRTCGSCPQGYLGDGYAGCRAVICATASDCGVLGTPPACSVWQCGSDGMCSSVEPRCDDFDEDGYQTGPVCACGATDCNDGDPSIGTRKACYTGPPATLGVGVCRAGNKSCSSPDIACTGERVPSGETCNGEDDDCNGSVDDIDDVTCGMGACQRTVPACNGDAPNACIPGEPLASGDGCNGVDDDCDGAVDEDCPTCIHVAENGDDAAALGSNGALAFRNVQPAIDFADAHRNVATTVCVAAGPTCGSNATYSGPTSAPLKMRNGISVLANYESTNWSRCADSSTILAPQTGDGVLFAAEVTSFTVLDGFTIDRFDVGATAASSGVTVDGGRGVLLSNLTIQTTPHVGQSYGVNVVNGGVATIFRSRIEAGFGLVESIAVRSVGAQVSLQDNCEAPPEPTTGRCNAPAGPGSDERGCGENTGPGIRATATETNTPNVRLAILLDDSPGSRVERSTVCAGHGYDYPTEVGALRMTGDASAILVRGSTIDVLAGSRESIAVRMTECQGGAPRFVGNDRIRIQSGEVMRVDAIVSMGDCHPIIESSNIAAITSGEHKAARALLCGTALGDVSRCVIEDSTIKAQASPKSLFGTNRGQEGMSGTGIYCDYGCARIEGNHVVGNVPAGVPWRIAWYRSVGLVLGSTGAFVKGNDIVAGCGADAVGVGAWQSWSTIQNNRIVGATSPSCSAPEAYGTESSSYRSVALTVSSSNASEVVVHSNLVDGGGPCAVLNRAGFEPLFPPAAYALSIASSDSVNVIRNNIVLPGACPIAVPVLANAPSRIFENNDILPGSLGVFVSNAGSNLTTIAAVNALAGASGNLSAPPGLTSDGLAEDSVCIDAGSSEGAPTDDFYGTPRDAHPDIGPYEYVP